MAAIATARGVRVLFAFLVMVATCVVGVASNVEPAAACTCMRTSLSDAVDRADAVFSGTLVSVKDQDRANSMVDRTLVFKVKRVYKGTVTRHQAVRTSSEGPACGLWVPRGPTFILLAYRPTPGPSPEVAPDEYVSSSCGGARTLNRSGAVPEFLGRGTAPKPS
jgi:hypothetical protein